MNTNTDTQYTCRLWTAKHCFDYFCKKDPDAKVFQTVYEHASFMQILSRFPWMFRLSACRH